MSCLNRNCKGKCYSPWACGWRDNYSQSETIVNGESSEFKVQMYDMPVRRSWLWQIAAAVLAVGACVAWVLL